VPSVEPVRFQSIPSQPCLHIGIVGEVIKNMDAWAPVSRDSDLIDLGWYLEISIIKCSSGNFCV
jgi:hypothetical protein